MSDVDELIERLEKATGPSRELDLAIAQHLPPSTEYSLTTVQMRGGRPPVPSFTSSIDAALTLVPEGWRTTHAYGGGDYWWHWNLTKDAKEYDEKNFASGKNKHPAIALCIAALRIQQESVK